MPPGGPLGVGGLDGLAVHKILDPDDPLDLGVVAAVGERHSHRQNRMRRRGRCAGPALVAARVYERSMAGSSGVPRMSIAVMSLAGRSLPDSPTSNAARQLPAVSSRRFSLRGNRACERTVAGPPGNLWRGVKDGRADRISRVGQYLTAHVRPGEYRQRLRQTGGSAVCPAGSRTAVGRRDAAGSAGFDGT
jgi:hypothetical protein